jgi:hypothetical protein
MRHQRWFVRKVVYLALLVVLLFPLYVLSHPETTAAVGEQGSPGGWLAALRREHQLSQASLGEIDPTSETIKLCTLGLRGVAAAVLWIKSDEYKDREDWTNFSAMLEQITKVQPNYVFVWRYQGWNLSFNVSIEWDDYYDRYDWVQRGIRFLRDGSRHNQHDMRLPWDEGWFTGYKIGRSDETRHYRQLFKQDAYGLVRDLYPQLSLDERDNWLAARSTFAHGVDLVDNRQVRIQAINPLLFFSEPAKCLMRYAQAIEDEGTFGDKAGLQWRKAYAEYYDGRFAFGSETPEILPVKPVGLREIVTSQGRIIRLLDLEPERDKMAQLMRRLDELVPGCLQRTRQKKLETLTDEQRRVYALPAEEARGLDKSLRDEVDLLLRHHLPEQVEPHIPPEDLQKPEVKALLDEARDVQETMRLILNARMQINYDYWLERCRAEMSDAGLRARQALYDARRKYDEDVAQARQPYEEAFRMWRQVLDEYPSLIADGDIGDDLMDEFRRYEEVLRRNNERLDSKTFILRDVIEQRAYRPLYGS